MGLYSVRALRRPLPLRCRGLSSACGSSKAFARLWPGQNPLIFMRFHEVLLGNQHEIWSKSTTEKSAYCGLITVEIVQQINPICNHLNDSTGILLFPYVDNHPFSTSPK